MVSIYDELKPVADEILNEFGQGVIKFIKLNFDPNADIDEPISLDDTVIEVDGVVRGVKFKYVQNGFATASDFQVTISTTGKNGKHIEPTEDDFIEIDGERYKIIKAIAKPGAGTKIVHVLIVRK